MGLKAIEVLAIAKKYTADTADTLGSLKGAPATIKSITEIDGGHRITFSWTGTSGQEQTQTMDVMDGEKGDTGATGAKGDDGAKGDTGEAGFSPIVTIIDIPGGHRVTITDASGEHSFDVMDGESGSGGDKVFVAVYGVTTAQEIIAFLDSGSPMPFFVERAGSYYTVTTASKQSDKRVIVRSFATISGNYYMFVYDITNDRWGSSNFGFQPLLESGLNIKTVNGESLLGGGNIIVKGDGSNDYETLDNKPIIEGVTVTGSKSADDYNLASKTYVDTNVGNIEVLLQTI